MTPEAESAVLTEQEAAELIRSFSSRYQMHGYKFVGVSVWRLASCQIALD